MSFARLVVDLDSVSANYRRFVEASAGLAGAVVKADAYGLGMEAVAQRLRIEGCEHFFVATPEEAFALRSVINKGVVYVFSGPRTRIQRWLSRWRTLFPCLIHPNKFDYGSDKTGRRRRCRWIPECKGLALTRKSLRRRCSRASNWFF